MAEPQDDRDAARDVARDLAEVATTLASMKVEAIAWLSDPGYDVLASGWRRHTPVWKRRS